MANSILVCIPAFGHMISAATFLSTHHLQSTLISKGIGTGITTMSFPDIAELRSMFLTIFHDTVQASHFLMVDADMGFQPNLIEEMLMLDEPIVGTIYPHRRLPQTWVGSGTGEAMAARRGNFMEVEGVGMGITLIRRDAVIKMVESFPDLIDTRIQMHPAFDLLRGAGCSRLIRMFEKLDLPERGVVSEDLSFCIRWRQLGGKVWASIGHRVSHVGQHDFAGRYLDQFEQQAPASPLAAMAAAAAQPQQPPTPPPQAAPAPAAVAA